MSSHLKPGPDAVEGLSGKVMNVDGTRRQRLPILSSPSKSTFSSLPIELRNQIYRQLLVTSDSEILIVHVPLSHFRPPDHRTRISWAKQLTLGLLYVNKAISLEAAAVLYTWNTFLFSIEGDMWGILSFFLDIIGARNRSYLRNIRAEISQPEQICRCSDGTLTSNGYGHRAFDMVKVLPRDKYPRRYLHGQSHTEHNDIIVDFVSPFIEDTFQLLGPNGPPLNLVLIMGFRHLPGVIRNKDGIPEDREYGWWSLEIPDHIESMRRKFTAKPEKEARVDVIWQGRGGRPHWERSLEITEEIWEVVEKNDILSCTSWWERRLEWLPEIQFKLRRKWTETA
ncbi:hypothetical protein G7Y89_g6720 [Cudoniella acicularis]|uniref:Uncharacterized protein n=1 Tax=Cudoniella acicularis TaxID=354080 RepID=A0A8H4W4H5_9HELO|nr:hypothetical protein G7Y89_g6720 [Cudoniella acicularis]